MPKIMDMMGLIDTPDPREEFIQSPEGKVLNDAYNAAHNRFQVAKKALQAGLKQPGIAYSIKAGDIRKLHDDMEQEFINCDKAFDACEDGFKAWVKAQEDLSKSPGAVRPLFRSNRPTHRKDVDS